MALYDENWIILPTCSGGPCPMKRVTTSEPNGWECTKCGAFKVDAPSEPITLDTPPTIKIHGYGCVVIIGMLFVFLGWLAYL